MKRAKVQHHRNLMRVNRPNFHGWVVQIKRRGRWQHMEEFADSRYGGCKRALERALLRREDLEARLPPATRLRERDSRNKTGVVGVSLIVPRRGRRILRYWRATWTELDGRRIQQTFAVAKYGAARARALATAARQDAVRRILGATGARPWWQKDPPKLPARNVVRVEREGSCGWLVSAGPKPATFEDAAHGGRHAALARALEYRDALELKQRPLPRLGRMKRRNRCGIVGVYRWERRGAAGRRLSYYGAHWTERDGTPGARAFAVSKYGARRARALAIAVRREALARMLGEWRAEQLARAAPA